MKSTSEKGTGVDTGEARFGRNPQILERQIEETVFLVNPEDDTVFYLNPLSAGIWRLLAQPICPAEAVDIVQQAFPDIAPEDIAADVSALFSELEDRDLIRRQADGAPPNPT